MKKNMYQLQKERKNITINRKNLTKKLRIATDVKKVSEKENVATTILKN